MTDHAFTDFEQLILNSKNQLGTSILLVLAWIASSDGHIDAQEAKQLSEISAASKHGISVQPIIRLAQKRDIEALQLACEIVASDFVDEKALRFLEMAIGMAIADGRLLPSENHILRFLADLLGVSNSSLNEIFINVTGRAIPFPSDVSSAEYWRERDNGNRRSDHSTSDKADHPSKAIAAYATLGLEPGASKEAIKQSYRRLAQIHHPDRFTALGEESVAAASQTFVRIREAYEYLVKYA